MEKSDHQSQIIPLGKTFRTREEIQTFFNIQEADFVYDFSRNNCRHYCLDILDFLQPDSSVFGYFVLRKLNQNLKFVNILRNFVEDIFEAEIGNFLRIILSRIFFLIRGAALNIITLLSYWLIILAFVEEVTNSAKNILTHHFSRLWPTLEIKVWKKGLNN